MIEINTNLSDIAQFINELCNLINNFIKSIKGWYKTKIKKKMINVMEKFKLLRPDIAYLQNSTYSTLLHIKNEGLIAHLLKNNSVTEDIFNKWLKYIFEQSEENKNNLIMVVQVWWENLPFNELRRIQKFLNIVMKKIELIRNFYNENKIIKKIEGLSQLVYNNTGTALNIKKITFHLTSKQSRYTSNETYDGDDIVDVELMDDDLLKNNYNKFIEEIKSNEFCLEIEFDNNVTVWLGFQSGTLFKHELWLPYNFNILMLKHVETEILKWIKAIFNVDLEKLNLSKNINFID